MIESYGKLLFSAFIAILIGIVLIQVIGDDVEKVKVAYFTSPNESVSLTAVTENIIEENITLTAATANILDENVSLIASGVNPMNGTLLQNDLTILTDLRNNTDTNASVLTECNVTLAIGTLRCNATRVTNNTVADYTFNQHLTGGATDQTYVTAFLGIRNTTGINASVLTKCNVTSFETGTLQCNYTAANYVLANYTYNKYSTGTLAQDEVISISACRNVNMTAISLTTDCNVTASDRSVVVNYDNFTTNNAYIDYTYDTDTYVASGAARTLLTLVVLFFALGILAVGIGYAWKSFKEGGII